MNYVSAVESAKEGKEEGFSFLYEATYREKYYISLKYMGNETDAQDVLQEAYIKAFQKLHTLEDPEKFSGWLGKIVANTAKNALERKRAIPFTELDVTVKDEQERFEYKIEDDSMEYQPEVAFTKKETQELVHELINSLSDEQRICVLMFHMEGQSIRDIADALGCSENTVKSRLNYGRKAIKKRAEELQKRGYKLYSIAAIPLLLYLLRLEKSFPEFVQAAQTAMMSDSSRSYIYQAVKVEKAATNTNLSQMFLHTALGKTLIAVVSVVIVGAAVSGIVVLNSRNPSEDSESSGIQSEISSNQNSETVISLADAYEQVLNSVSHKEPGYDFTQNLSYPPLGSYHYALYDIDGDGISELIVRTDSESLNYCSVFSCVLGDNGYQPLLIEGGFYQGAERTGSTDIYVPSEGQGLYLMDFLHGTGKQTIYRISMQENTIQISQQPETSFIFGDEQSQAFNEKNTALLWYEISDKTPLQSLK